MKKNIIPLSNEIEQMDVVKYLNYSNQYFYQD